jgi:magnesium transporter
MTSKNARSLITTAIPICKKTDIAGGVMALIQNTIKTFASIDYIYVLEGQTMIGVLSIHELFSASPQATIEDVMVKNPAYVHAMTDRAHVAELALAESIRAVPVVGETGEFLGVVPGDTVIQILNEEHSDYLFKATGIRRPRHALYRELSLWGQVKTRTPWLVIGLFGGIAGAMIVRFFEHSLEEQIFVAAFIPAIVYIADAVGNQSEMLVVRALSRERNFSIKKYLSRELAAGVLISVLLSSLMFVLSYVWLKNFAFSLTLAIAVISTTLFSITFTVTLPWILKRLGFDPAVASGPIATVVCDVSSVTIYLLIAVLVL